MIQPIFSDIQPILSDTEPIFSRYSAAEPKNSTSIIDRERYSGRYLPTSASMLDADTWQLDRRCRMKSSAVRTARTMRRSAAKKAAFAPSLVARSAWRMFGSFFSACAPPKIESQGIGPFSHEPQVHALEAQIDRRTIIFRRKSWYCKPRRIPIGTSVKGGYPGGLEGYLDEPS